MADPVSWQTVAQAVLPGAIGGFIGAGSALYGAKRAGDRDRDARREQADRDRAQRREDALTAALRRLLESHTSTFQPATVANKARADNVSVEEWQKADLEFGAAHLAAVRAQEDLRILSRSEAVRSAVEELRTHQGDVYEYASGKPPKKFSTVEASRTMRELLRRVTDAVQAEVDALWTKP